MVTYNRLVLLYYTTTQHTNPELNPNLIYILMHHLFFFLK